jgi:hypothetical protein
MSVQKSGLTVDRPVEVEIPDSRKYKSKDDADLDRALVDAIEAANETGNDYLVQLLSTELGSHYYEAK